MLRFGTSDYPEWPAGLGEPVGHVANNMRLEQGYTDIASSNLENTTDLAEKTAIKIRVLKFFNGRKNLLT